MELGVSQLLLTKMIVGHGIDIEALASIQNAVEKREGFARRVFTDQFVTASVILEEDYEN